MQISQHRQSATMLHAQRGFTLVELMVTVAVAIIMLSVAVPGFNDMTRSNKLTTTVNTFVLSLRLARNEAIKSGGATVCASKDGTSCSGADWTLGWIVFSDFNLDGVLNGDDTLVRVNEAMPAGTKLPTVSATTATYAGTGFLNPPQVNLTIDFCAGRTGIGAGRTVAVNRTGRPTTTNYDSCT